MKPHVRNLGPHLSRYKLRRKQLTDWPSRGTRGAKTLLCRVETLLDAFAAPAIRASRSSSRRGRPYPRNASERLAQILHNWREQQDAPEGARWSRLTGADCRLSCGMLWC